MVLTRVRPTRLVLSTFDPSKLRPSDWQDISGLRGPYLTLPSLSSLSLAEAPRARISYGHHLGRSLNFPPNTRGFFYYYTPPKAPPLLGELRFRLTADTESFQDATSGHRSKATIRDQLLHDGLISKAVLDKWTNVKQPGGDVILYYLRQPFFFSFSNKFIRFFTVTDEEIGCCILFNPLVDYRIMCIPYGGSCIAQLEPSLDGDSVSFRILKIIEPVQNMYKGYNGYIHPPAEGVLLQRSFPWETPIISTRSLTKIGMKSAATLPVNYEDLP